MPTSPVSDKYPHKKEAKGLLKGLQLNHNGEREYGIIQLKTYLERGGEKKGDSWILG